ncbi:tetratricopeptide repeat protein [Lactobacillus xylocopicola]|uniref:Tetratricopeptide repeat protein n=1 Tax=Lactobacillus xylocopicola TaxID=2976676 RepID=A0ABN6SMV9_9LACO|nr:tetratricopeptide repeat protein [Lactobacillus xylocopicola]BDR60436.1 hypothetical protein KIM322_06970 [Lactobacillus xylocopicola]
MTSLSQQNLLNLAQKNERQGDLLTAIQNVEEAQQGEYSQEVTLRLCDLYLKNQQANAAYSLIKEEKDLFSDQAILATYSKILQANHFLIEARQLENLSQGAVVIAVSAATPSVQQEIMRTFKQKTQPTQYDYQQLLKLDEANFKSFAQSLLIDPSLSFAVRLALCEDLIRLGVADQVKVLVLGDVATFIPKQTSLLEKNPIYREVIYGIGSRYYHRPSQIPAVLGEVNLILGSLYPKLDQYVDEPDSFARDIASYLEKHDGQGNQELFEKIDQYLPK